MFEIMTKNFWAMAIIVTCINVAIYKFRSQKHIDENPALAEGYAKIIKGYLIWMNIPWIVMGIGCTLGSVETPFDYFNPREGNPFVLAWFASIFFLWILGTYWLFFKKGAEMLVQHPGMLNYDMTSPTALKLLWCVCLIGGIFGVAMMWSQQIPTP